MPYIKEEDKERIWNQLLSFPYDLGVTAQSPGELNFMITEMILGYLDDKVISYSSLNEVVGVLECCKQEFIRRRVSPYEDEKIKENGDVY